MKDQGKIVVRLAKKIGSGGKTSQGKTGRIEQWDHHNHRWGCNWMMADCIVHRYRYQPSTAVGYVNVNVNALNSHDRCQWRQEQNHKAAKVVR
jgi:hypothetical protein